jgi:EAL domain-containing protein (putative c-di-GMP-specific phosphodiesterase class I)
MLADADGVRAEAVARELQNAIGSRLFSVNQEPVRVSASAGITTLRPDAPEDRPLRRAEFAMYLAKEAGPDGLVLLAEVLDRDQLAELEHAGRIRRALDHGALTLNAQPVLHIGSGTVEQWELLVRLRQDGDVIPAAAFLPLAERFGAVEHIDRWVVRRAIGILAERSGSRQAVRLEVNLSRRSIGDPVLLDLLRKELHPELVRPWDLILELREDAICAEPSAAQAFAADVRALGCRIAVDDFSGEDDRAVAAIASLAPDFVKISGQLVRHLPGGDGDRAAVRRIVALARRQGKQTIAQFVGDDETIALLGHYGVDYAQGYHVGVPGPVSEIRPRKAPTRDGSPGARPPERRAHLGESLVLPGFETQLRIAALRVIDPLPNGASGKTRRKRLVGVEVELENVGASRYAYAPDGCARLVTDRGARVARTSSFSGQEPGDTLPTGVELQPGATVRGCVPFRVRHGHDPELFRFVPESGRAAVTGEWSLY